MGSNFFEKSGVEVHRTPRYHWYQGVDDVVVHVPCSAAVRGKDVDVKITAHSLRCAVRACDAPSPSPSSSSSSSSSSSTSSSASTPPTPTPAFTVLIDGALFGTVKVDDSFWTLEDGEPAGVDVNEARARRDAASMATAYRPRYIAIALTKARRHESWTSVVRGDAEVDAATKERMDKKMMLEKFQTDHPGFDFSGAEFTGQLPDDPANFGRFDK